MSINKTTFLALMGLVLFQTVTSQITGAETTLTGTGGTPLGGTEAVETVDPAINSDVAGAPTSIDANAPDSFTGGSPTALDSVAVASVTTASPVIPTVNTEPPTVVTTAAVEGPPQSPDQVGGGAINTDVNTPTGGQPNQPAPSVTSNIPLAGGTTLQADVTDTVLALLSETGYVAKPTDPNVQELVTMLMNGTVPTESDLMRLNVVPANTTSPTYDVMGPGTNTGNNPVVNFGNPPLDSNMPPTSGGGGSVPTTGGTGTGTSDPLGGFTGGIPPMTDPNLTGGPTNTGGSTNTGGLPTTGTIPTTDIIPTGGLPTSGGVPLPGGAANTGTLPPAGSTGSVGLPFPGTGLPLPGLNPLPTGTNPNNPPLDPFNLNPGGILPATNPNAVGPKPFPGGVGGTPGSPNDLLNSLTLGGGQSIPSTPQGGILDYNPGGRPATQNSNRNNNNGMNSIFSNPLMMMMLMGEGMEMGGENGMLTMMVMNQIMNRNNQRRRAPPRSSMVPSPSGVFPSASGFPTGVPPVPSTPGMGSTMPAGGSGSGGLMDLLAGTGGGVMPTGTGPMPGIAPSPGGPGGSPSMMEMLNSLTGGPGTGAGPTTGGLPNPNDLMSLVTGGTAPGSGAGTAPLSTGPASGSPMDMFAAMSSPAGLTSPTSGGTGTEMMNLMNMVNGAGTGGGAASPFMTPMAG